MPRFDLSKILKTWYEIARTPNAFEDETAFNVTATYSARPDGSINVVNTQYVNAYVRDGRMLRKKIREDKAVGIGRISDPDKPNQLVVTFGPRVTDINYEIILYDANYSYMLVHTPETEMMWILSATPSLPQKTLNELYNYIRNTGFDVTKLKLTQQTATSTCVIL